MEPRNPSLLFHPLPNSHRLGGTMASSSSSITTLPPFLPCSWLCNNRRNKRIEIRSMGGRDRGKNRRPLQRGRTLSIEAIQTVQSLKRVSDVDGIRKVLESNFRRLLKLDMLAVLRELIRQNQPLLALLVFEDVRKEYWYKPQVVLYTEMITMFASNNVFEKVELLVLYLKTESFHLDADTEGFNALFRTLMDFGFTTYALECFQLMKECECEPNESTFRILVDGFKSKGETDSSSMLKQEAEKYFGWPLEWNEEREQMDVSLTDNIGQSKAC